MFKVGDRIILKQDFDGLKKGSIFLLKEYREAPTIFNNKNVPVRYANDYEFPSNMYYKILESSDFKTKIEKEIFELETMGYRL